MAMSDTMSNPTDWMRFYRGNIAGQEAPPPAQGISSMFGRVSDSTVTTTTVTSLSTPATGTSSTSGVHLNPDGRVSKPSRRRSRASRRVPTTLLNTDTTNFRAMVQQFTGVPNVPFSSGSQTGVPNFNFGVGAIRPHHLNATSIMIPSGYHLLHEQQQQQQQQQHQQHMFSMNNTSDVFLPRLSNPRPNLEVSDGFLMESIFLPRAS